MKLIERLYEDEESDEDTETGHRRLSRRVSCGCGSFSERHARIFRIEQFVNDRNMKKLRRSFVKRKNVPLLLKKPMWIKLVGSARKSDDYE